MSITEEFQLYHRLAKELIETRLDVEPTDERVNSLANAIQSLEKIEEANLI